MSHVKRLGLSHDDWIAKAVKKLAATQMKAENDEVEERRRRNRTRVQKTAGDSVCCVGWQMLQLAAARSTHALHAQRGTAPANQASKIGERSKRLPRPFYHWGKTEALRTGMIDSGLVGIEGGLAMGGRRRQEKKKSKWRKLGDGDEAKGNTLQRALL